MSAVGFGGARVTERCPPGGREVNEKAKSKVEKGLRNFLGSTFRFRIQRPCNRSPPTNEQRGSEISLHGVGLKCFDEVVG